MPEPVQTSPVSASRERDWSAKSLVVLGLITLMAFLAMGYHPGLEDDSFYLAAIKRDLNPALFPHDADFFRLQFQATIFDKLIAFSVRVSHLPIAWAVLLWQLAGIFLLLHGCWRISWRCFPRPEGQWCAVALVAALLSMPIGGIAINLADQYLHPRTLATAAILAAVVAVIDRRLWSAGVWLAAALLIHIIMASFGISFCLFLYWRMHAPKRTPLSSVSPAVALLIPLGWIFEPASDAWRQAAATRDFYFLSRWQWYEWLGVFAPLVMFFVYVRFLWSRAERTEALRSFLSALLWYGCFQMVAGILVMLPSSLERLKPLEPMRYLHLLYVFFFLISGGLLGSYVLRRGVYRWLLLFLPLSAGMFYAQRSLYPSSKHLELPFEQPRNEWLQAFTWIRQNAPVDSLFAVDPHYESLQGEDYHGFRALAERSVLADYAKDAGMVARVPSLASRWLKEVTARNGWRHFGLADLQRLKNEFGATWFIFSRSDELYSVQRPDIVCPYQNQELKICHIY